ncbi:MAG: RIP metalloprotease RseP [Patescibacteria group bacterium]
MTILISILIISFLIFIHELGHFLAAKKSGMLVEEFGLGIPPRIFGKKIGETVYSINLIPFGGFVRIFGDIDSKADKQDKRSFIQKSPWKKLLVVFAGIIMNFLLGFLIYWGLFYAGNEMVLNESNRTKAENIAIGILQVAKNSPASKADLNPGDKVLAIKTQDQTFSNLSESGFVEIAKQNAGKEIILILDSGQEIEIVPRETPPSGEGALGVVIAEIGTVKYPFFEAFYQAIKYSFKASVYMFSMVFQILSNLVFKGETANLTGPIGIVSFTSNVIKAGLSQTFSFIALISLNLAVFNLLPLPALDGGRIVFVTWEIIAKKPVPAKYESWVHSLGMVLLLSLLVLVTIADIKRLF